MSFVPFVPSAGSGKEERQEVVTGTRPRAAAVSARLKRHVMRGVFFLLVFLLRRVPMMIVNQPFLKSRKESRK
jgi:hypothetical protein